MPTSNILTVFPLEIFDHIFSLLSKSRPDIGACRLTCRVFHLLSSPYLVPSVVVANNLDVLYRTHHIIQHPYFSRHVTELVYVQGRYEPDDEAKYDSAFEDMDWEDMDEEDKLLWQDLSRYSDYPCKRFRGFEKSGFNHRSLLDFPDFHDYIAAIRTNMLEELLNKLPSLRHIILTNFRSGRAKGLTRSTHEWETDEDSDLYWGPA